MKIELAAAARIVPFTALMLGACSRRAPTKAGRAASGGAWPSGSAEARNREPAAGADPSRTVASQSCRAPVEETSMR
jgi:hypothetical protein